LYQLHQRRIEAERYEKEKQNTPALQKMQHPVGSRHGFSQTEKPAQINSAECSKKHPHHTQHAEWTVIAAAEYDSSLIRCVLHSLCQEFVHSKLLERNQ